MAVKNPLWAVPGPDVSDGNQIDPTHEHRAPMSVSDASESGSRLEELRAMRWVIARHVDSPDTLARDLAALTRRLMEISREIEILRMESEGDAIGNAAGSPDESFDASAV